MSEQNTTRELYGGAITVQLPSDSIDASDLRQIPDHQEVFLSSQTLTSIIFEINEYQTATAVEETATTTTITAENNINDDTAPPLPSTDSAAATHHLTDLLSPPDHFLDPPGVHTTPTTLTHPSLSKFPSYISTATIISHEIDRFARTTLPESWQTNPAQKEHQVETLQLLVRMREYSTDLCVRITVPLKELGDSSQTEEGRREGRHAREVMGRIAESLDVRDFGLFGGEE